MTVAVVAAVCGGLIVTPVKIPFLKRKRASGFFIFLTENRSEMDAWRT
ncbi:hypothetical protein SAMN06296020_102369 [Anoxynatronum buryatiense]|uniref:Uncharacterized protein n=1 Tax=Anoxynatronum buryatiense TaxID=489973 RepID=A0AA45WUF6_9CLOT|nr:hypothetical protein SAMN06296020_102369 [Anoxynatronum buryatiense]